MGIEPTLEAWEAAVLPLNYTRLVKALMALYEKSPLPQHCCNEEGICAAFLTTCLGLNKFGLNHYNIAYGNRIEWPAYVARRPSLLGSVG